MAAYVRAQSTIFFINPCRGHLTRSFRYSLNELQVLVKFKYLGIFLKTYKRGHETRNSYFLSCKFFQIVKWGDCNKTLTCTFEPQIFKISPKISKIITENTKRGVYIKLGRLSSLTKLFFD